MPAQVLRQVQVGVVDLTQARPAWDWLMERLGGEPFRTWPGGRSWSLDEWVLCLVEGERSPAQFHFVIPERDVDVVESEAAAHGWRVDRDGDPGWGPPTLRLTTDDGPSVVLMAVRARMDDHL